jgi:DNA-binding CsgD family transcriptional regulator
MAYRRGLPIWGRPIAVPQLTDREHEILDLVTRGQTNTSIATRLSISEKTVRNHVSNIFTKLAVADRAQSRRARPRSRARHGSAPTVKENPVRAVTSRAVQASKCGASKRRY